MSDIERVLQIHQKHQIMSQVDMCTCGPGRPCEIRILLGEIQRLNELAKGLLRATASLADSRQADGGEV